MFCGKCGTQNADDSLFCKECGAPLDQAQAVDHELESADSADVIAVQPMHIARKRNLKMGIAAAVAALLAVAVITVYVLLPLFSVEDKADFFLYYKDGEVYGTSLSNGKLQQMEGLCLDEKAIETYYQDWGYYQVIDSYNSFESDSGMFYVSDCMNAFADCIQMSKDGRILFYTDLIEHVDGGGMSLSYCYINKPEQDLIEIAENVSEYIVSESDKIVTYLTYDEHGLYQYNFNDKEKIDNGIDDYRVSTDGKKIVYRTENGDLYLKNAGKEKEKIDSAVSSISYISESFDTVYYEKGDSLYKKAEEEEKEKIASDVAYINKIYESGEIYYTKTLMSQNKTLLDYVEDDMQETDAVMTEPKEPDDYIDFWDYDDYDEYYAAWENYEIEYEQYEAAMKAWNERNQRDELRLELADETISEYDEILCYYDGKTEVAVADNYDSSITSSRDCPVIVFSAYQEYPAEEKLKLSEIGDVSEASQMIRDAIYSTREIYLAAQDKISEIGLGETEASNFMITPDGKTIYFFKNLVEIPEWSAAYNRGVPQQGDVCKISISDSGQAQEPEVYANNVYEGAYLTSDGKFVCYQNMCDWEGELYIDGQKIDSGVNLFSVTYLAESDMLLYLCGDSYVNGVLKVFADGEIVTIADHVSYFYAKPSGEVLYLRNYDFNELKGELFSYKNKESEKFDDGVQGIIPVDRVKYPDRQ